MMAIKPTLKATLRLLNIENNVEKKCFQIVQSRVGKRIPSKASLVN